MFTSSYTIYKVTQRANAYLNHFTTTSNRITKFSLSLPGAAASLFIIVNSRFKPATAS